MAASTRVALVTGGSRGIGASIVRSLADDGYHVAFTYHKAESEATELQGQLTTRTRVKCFRADLAVADERELLRQRVQEEFGSLDVLINNAGAIDQPSDYEHLTEDSWRNTLELNARAPLHCAQLFRTALTESPCGRIVNISSVYGITGAPSVIAYTAAKAALINITRSLAVALAPNVTVNAVAPGNIDTDMTRGAPQDFIDLIISRTPFGRLGHPSEIAAVVRFLSSHEASFVTGQTIVVDGGFALATH